jgi:hypothetical protein
MKNCFKCGQSQPLSEFYTHSRMADGHLNKCKTCTKIDVHNHRVKNIDRIKRYDNSRWKNPDRKKANRVSCIKVIMKDPSKRSAHGKVKRAIASGRLTKNPCEKCGSPYVEAHHDDYTKPLDVRWLCKDHHEEVHHPNAKTIIPIIT